VVLPLMARNGRFSKTLGRAVGALGLVVVLGVAVPAWAGIALDMDYAGPDTSDVVLRWEFEGTGPFTLRTWDIEGSGRVADALAADPAGHVALTGLEGGSLTLPGETMLPRAIGTRAYQIIDEGDGSCSNLGYVARREGLFAEQPVSLAIPDRSSLRTLSAVLDRFPAVRRVEIVQSMACRRVALERVPGGRFGMDAFIPLGKGVEITLSRDADIAIVGASGSRHDGTRIDLRGDCRNDVQALEHVSSPFGVSWSSADDLLCGLEGIDWVDADLDGSPDACLQGIFDGASLFLVTLSPRRGGDRALIRVVRAQLGQPTFSFSGFVLDPIAGWSVRASRGGRIPSSVTLATQDLGAPAACRCADTDGDGDDDCTELLMGTDPDDPASRGPDTDRDGLPDDADDCPANADPLQGDRDGDGFGDACDPDPDDALNGVVDPDGDGVLDGIDDCPDVSDPRQEDRDGDGVGSACDNCPRVRNTQADSDADGYGDECDSCPMDPTFDTDEDGICTGDNCPFDANSSQLDDDQDGFGNECDCAAAPVQLPEVAGLRVAPVGGSAEIFRRLSWQADDQWGPALFDIRAGLLDTMHSQRSLLGGDCVRSSVRDDTFVEGPVAGSRWYLVRTRTACGTSVLGDAGPPGGPNPRDVLVDDTGWHCP